MTMAIGLILVVIPVLSACKTTEPSPVPETKEIHMLAYKWGWDPQVIVVQKGTIVKFHITVPEHHHEAHENVHPEEYHHGLGISAYGINVDLPIGETEVEFVANKVGEFPFTCTVWCGINQDGKIGHHTMTGKLIVYDGENPPAGYSETPDDYHYLPRIDEGDHPHEDDHHEEEDHHNGDDHHK